MMIKAFTARFSPALLVPATLLAVCLSTLTVRAQTRLYDPISLPANNEITDSLSDKDIPTGQGGFARDYVVNLDAGDNVAIDLTSENFDTIVTLLKNGATVAENDDGADGSTNSLLFTRIKEKGAYIIRVRAFGETAGGEFKLKVRRLREI
ncbi:PPC domain-containing protein [Aerosakkonema funiforme]